VRHVRLPPFNAVVFRGDDGGRLAERWEPLLARIERAVFEAEFGIVGEFGRRCNTVLLPPGGGQQTLELIRRYGLLFYPITQVRAYQGYAHTHEKPRHPGEAALFGVACIEIDDALRFAEAYQRGDHYTQGKLLGYPECCIKAFIEDWNAGYYSPVIQEVRRTPGCHDYECRIDPLLNPTLRYIGVKAIPFWPHNLVCREAHRWAEHFIDVVRRIDKKAYKALLELLAEPVEFSQVNGIIEVRVGSPPWMLIISQGYSDETIRVRLIPMYDPVEEYG